MRAEFKVEEVEKELKKETALGGDVREKLRRAKYKEEV